MKTWFQFKSATQTQYGCGTEGEARRYFRDLDSAASDGRYAMTRLPLGDSPPKDAKQLDMTIELARTAKTARPR